MLVFLNIGIVLSNSNNGNVMASQSVSGYHAHLELRTEMKEMKQWVIVKKSSPKNLSVDCRSTVGRHITDRLPTANRQVTDS